MYCELHITYLNFIWPWSVQADQWQADPYSNVRGDAGQEEERGGLLPEIWWSGVLQVRSRVSPKDVPVQCLKYTSSVLYAYHFMKKCFSLFMLDIKKIFVFFTVEVMTLNTDAMISNWSREFRDLFQVGVSCTQYDRTQSSRSVQ